jgi:hypothetical protein
MMNTTIVTPMPLPLMVRNTGMQAAMLSPLLAMVIPITPVSPLATAGRPAARLGGRG